MVPSCFPDVAGPSGYPLIAAMLGNPETDAMCQPGRIQGEQISSEMRSRADIETASSRRCPKSNAARTSRIAGPLFEQNLNGTRSETEHAELLLAEPVGRVDRLRLAEIGDRLGQAAQS